MVNSARGKIKPLKIVLWSILGVILLFICIVLGTLLVQKYIKKSKVPTFAGYGYFVVITDSMTGTIDKGDLIIIKKTNDYTLGDIVTFVNSRDEVVTHRIVNYQDPNDKTVFITKGDFNPTTDGTPISADQIAGEVVLTIPKVGVAFEWFLHDLGWVYFIAIAAVVVAGVYFWGLIKPSDASENDAQPKE